MNHMKQMNRFQGFFFIVKFGFSYGENIEIGSFSSFGSCPRPPGFIHTRVRDYSIEAAQGKLPHIAQVVNSKSYYDKYAGLIDKARKSMTENGMIAEVREVEVDERGVRRKARLRQCDRLRRVG